MDPDASNVCFASRTAPAGFSVLELLIAGMILTVLGASIVAAGARSRKNIDYEEVRRRAIVLCQARFETVRAEFSFDDIVPANLDTTITLDGTTFTLRSHVAQGSEPASPDTLDDFIKFVSDTVAWDAQGWNTGQIVRRRVVMGTYFFGGFLEGP